MCLLPGMAFLTGLLFLVFSTLHVYEILANENVFRGENGRRIVEKGTCTGGETMSKMDRRLLEEIQERRQRVMIEGGTTQELALEQYQVTIELTQTLSPLKGRTREETLRDMESQTQTHQTSVVNALRDIGVTDFQVLLLSNSIKTNLTMEQIDKIAKHPDVKIVRLVKPVRVITPE